eukprot:2289122-Amphidinium_carterae.2
METACIRTSSGKVKTSCLNFFPELVSEGDTPKKATKKGGVNLKELIGSTTKRAGYGNYSVKTWSSHFFEVQEQRERSVTMLGNAITASWATETLRLEQRASNALLPGQRIRWMKAHLKKMVSSPAG